MTLDTLKTTGHLQVMDILMFIMSPFNMVMFIAVKLTSHFFTLENVVYTSKNLD